MRPVWVIIAVLVALGIVALVLAVRGRAQIPPSNPDPLFIAGIAVTGAGAALVATVGSGAIVIGVIGIIMLAVGARRSRDRAGR